MPSPPGDHHQGLKKEALKSRTRGATTQASRKEDRRKPLTQYEFKFRNGELVSVTADERALSKGSNWFEIQDLAKSS